MILEIGKPGILSRLKFERTEGTKDYYTLTRGCIVHEGKTQTTKEKDVKVWYDSEVSKWYEEVEYGI